MLADVIRIEAVLHYGGVYVDSDTAPGPRALENIEAELWSSFIASPGRPVQKEPVPNNIPWINNCLFGFPIQHPFLTWLWNNISSRLPLSDNPRPIGSPYLATGPSYYRMAYRRMPEEHRPRVLSMLSIPDINDKLWKTPPSLDKAIAVHYQQGSWYDWKERLEKP
jgi:mannosyltransferase OCH1-like enzyme